MSEEMVKWFSFSSSSAVSQLRSLTRIGQCRSCASVAIAVRLKPLKAPLEGNVREHGRSWFSSWASHDGGNTSLTLSVADGTPRSPSSTMVGAEWMENWDPHLTVSSVGSLASGSPLHEPVAPHCRAMPPHTSLSPVEPGTGRVGPYQSADWLRLSWRTVSVWCACV